MPRLISKMPTHKFKNKDTKIDSKDVLNFVWIAEAFFLGGIAGVLLSVFVMVIGK